VSVTANFQTTQQASLEALQHLRFGVPANTATLAEPTTQQTSAGLQIQLQPTIIKMETAYWHFKTTGDTSPSLDTLSDLLLVPVNITSAPVKLHI
jgi:hypothetical protein